MAESIYVPDYKNPYRGKVCIAEGCDRARAMGAFVCSKACAKKAGQWYCDKGLGGHYTLAKKTTRGVCPDCCEALGFEVKFKAPKGSRAAEPGAADEVLRAQLEWAVHLHETDIPGVSPRIYSPDYPLWYFTVHRAGPLAAPESLLLGVLERVEGAPEWLPLLSKCKLATEEPRAMTLPGFELWRGLCARRASHGETASLEIGPTVALDSAKEGPR